MKKCSILGREYDGFGNNAYPFRGRCCDEANEQYVIPARVMGITPIDVQKYGKKAIMVHIDLTARNNK